MSQVLWVIIWTETKIFNQSSYIPMHYTTLTLIFGMGALLLHLMALSYLTALSFSTVINVSDWGHFCCSISWVFWSIITPMTGLAALAYFNGCDPVLNGQLENNDHIMPFLAAVIFKNLPGLTRLYIRGLLCNTLHFIDWLELIRNSFLQINLWQKANVKKWSNTNEFSCLFLDTPLSLLHIAWKFCEILLSLWSVLSQDWHRKYNEARFTFTRRR